jgi:hypothetical protein
MALLWIPLMVMFPWLWEQITGTRITVHGLRFLRVMLVVYGSASQFPGWLALHRMTSLRSVSPAEVSRYPDEFAFRFPDGRVRMEYRFGRIAQSYDNRRSTTTHAYLVAPITGRDWTPAEPVTAWAVCAQLKLSSAAGVRLLRWTTSIEAEQARRVRYRTEGYGLCAYDDEINTSRSGHGSIESSRRSLPPQP